MQSHRILSIAISLVLLLAWARPASPLDGGMLRLETFNGWKAFEVISQGEDPTADGFAYSMLGAFDGLGAWPVDVDTLRVLVNHETGDAVISEVDLDTSALAIALQNVIESGTTGGGRFVNAARQAYDRWSSNGGASFVATSSNSNTSFSRFCSSQSYSANTFGNDRGFVDEIYVTGEEVSNGRLFALDLAGRDLYQLSGVVGSAPGGTGGMPFDAWENAALIDTGETGHIALLLSPDGGTQRMQLYIGEKGKDETGLASNDFLARNGLRYGSWYFLNGNFPTIGNTNGGTFDTTSTGALASDKLEDVDTSPSQPNLVVLGDQTSGVFTFDFDLDVDGGFDASASSFMITKVSDTTGGEESLNSPDNVDWTDATLLDSTAYPAGLVFVNEDNSSGEIWQMNPDGTSKVRVARTTVGSESTGVLDISSYVGFRPGSIILTNNQGSPASLSVLIHPEATSNAAVTGIGGASRMLLVLGLAVLGALRRGGAAVLATPQPIPLARSGRGFESSR